MYLVYENNEQPYYKHRTDMTKRFEAVVNAIDKWTLDKSKNTNDECNGIISSTFNQYKYEDLHAELIVRVMQILAEFDDDEEKSNYLQIKYKELFEYFYDFVFPELKNFDSKSRENVRKVNKCAKLLKTLTNSKLELSNPKDITVLMDDKLVIITTNSPKLLLLNIYNYLYTEYGDLFDSQNIFINFENLMNKNVLKDLKNVLATNHKLRVFVKILSGNWEDLQKIIPKKTSNFKVIIFDEIYNDNILDSLKAAKLEATKVDMNYKLNDLSVESQKMLLLTKVNFQNNLQYSIIDLLNDETESKEMEKVEEKIIQDLSEIIDSQPFNLLLENFQIEINQAITNDLYAKNFEFLFQPRHFSIKKDYMEVDKKSHDLLENKNIQKTKSQQMISQDELLLEVKNQKYIIISDIAGTGKSWAMKMFANILCLQTPKRWITYVDLKQFINEFRTKEEIPDFSNFMIDKILKPKDNFNSNIFKKLYSNGKVSIFFDGFDEIAPDCAEFVSKLVKSFESNGGNQLWIATRDYFELDLKEILGLTTAYKLNEFTEKDGINFISRSWSLKDFEIKIKSSQKEDFEKFIKNSNKFEIYQKRAHWIFKRIKMSKSHSIGMPQLFKMIADIFKSDENITPNFDEFMIYETFAKTLYERWSLSKGDLRRIANTNSQKWNLNFWRFHQFVAIKSLFPNYFKFFDFENDFKKWCDEEIIACGILTKKFGIFLFLHDTFREFFVADFIENYLSKTLIDDEFLIILVNILTVEKYGIIRMFLNAALKNSSILDKIQNRMQNFLNDFYKMETFAEFFSKSLENFVDFIIAILKSGVYEEVMKILNEKVIFEICCTKNSIIFSKFENFLFQFSRKEDLRKILQTRDQQKRNLLQIAAYKSNVSTHKNLWSIFRKLCENDKEFLNILGEVDSYGRNTLHVAGCRSKSEVFEFMIDELNGIKQCSEIKTLLSSLGDVKQTLIQSAAFYFKSLKLHQKLWNIYCKYFKPIEILVLIKHRNIENNNLIIDILRNTKEIVEFTWNQMKNFMTYPEQKECLQTKGWQDQNLVERSLDNNEVYDWVQNVTHQYGVQLFITDFKYSVTKIEAYVRTENEKNFQILWKELEKMLQLQNSTQSFEDVFVKVARGKSKNIFYHVIRCSNVEIHKIFWNLMFKSIEKEVLKNLIIQHNRSGTNFIHDLIIRNKSIAVIEGVLDIFKNNFDNNQLRNILLSKNDKNKNLLQNAAHEVIEIQIYQILWKTIHEFSNNDQEFLELLGNTLHTASCSSSSEIFEFILKELNEIPKLNEIEILLNCLGEVKQNLLQSAACFQKSIKLHEDLWKIYQKYFESIEILNLIKHTDEYGDNLLLNIIKNNKTQIADFTWNKIKSLMNIDEQVEYLKTKGWNNQNILERSLQNNYHPEIHEWIQTIVNQYKIQEEFKNFRYFLTKIKSYVCTENEKNLKSLRLEIKTFFESQCSISILTNLSTEMYINNENILQYVIQCKKIEIHEILWDLMFRSFRQKEELLKFILQMDEFGNNFLHNLININKSSYLIEFTFNIFKNNFINVQYEEILNSKDGQNRNLLQIAACHSNDLKLHQRLWKIFQNCFFFYDILKQVDKKGRNILHIALTHSTNEVLIFFLKQIEKKLSPDEIKNFLTDLGDKKQSLLQSAVCFNKSLSLHEHLWKYYHQYLNESEFIELIKHVDQNGDNIMFDVVKNSSYPIAEFIWCQIKELISFNEQVEFLKLTECNDQNLFERSLENEEHPELQEWILNIMNEYKIIENIEAFKNLIQNIETCIQTENSKELMNLLIKMDNSFFITHSIEGFESYTKLGSIKNRSIFKSIVKCKKREVYNAFWELLFKFTRNKDQLKDFILQPGRRGLNFMHTLLMENKHSFIIELTFKIFINNFNESQVQEILNTKDDKQRNLLQFAVCSTKLIKKHRILWSIFKRLCKNEEKFLSILDETDEDNRNTLDLAACYSTNKIFKMMLNELKQSSMNDQVRKLLSSLEDKNAHFLPCD